MPNDAVTFAVAAAAPPELALAAAGLAEGLEAIGRSSETLVDPWPESLSGRSRVVEVGDRDAASGGWRLDLGSRAELELIGAAEALVPIAFTVPSLPRADRIRRVLFIGGDAGRRTRMMGKTFEALRRRGCAVAVWRALPDELLRQRFPGEVHADVSAGELARLLGAAAALVEVSDEATVEGMLAAAIGRASGIPTVVHEALPVSRWEGSLRVSEWNGEAFAEAAIMASGRSRADAVAAAVRRECAERMAGALG